MTLNVNNKFVFSNPKTIALNSFLGAFSGLFIIWFLILNYNAHTFYLYNCFGLIARSFCFYLFTVFVLQSTLGSLFSNLKNISMLLIYARMLLIILLAVVISYFFTHDPETFSSSNAGDFLYSTIGILIFGIINIERMAVLSYSNPAKNSIEKCKTIISITSSFYLGVILSFFAALAFYKYCEYTSTFIFAIILTLSTLICSIFTVGDDIKELFSSPFTLITEKSSLNETIFSQFHELKKYDVNPTNIILCSISYALTLLVIINLTFINQSTLLYFNISSIIGLFISFFFGFIFLPTFAKSLIVSIKQKYHFSSILLAGIIGVISCLIISLFLVNIQNNTVIIYDIRINYNIANMLNCFIAGIFMSLVHNPLYYKFYNNINSKIPFYHAISLYMAIRSVFALICTIAILPLQVYPLLSNSVLLDDFLDTQLMSKVENFNILRVIITTLLLSGLALFLLIKKLSTRTGNKEWKNF